MAKPESTRSTSPHRRSTVRAVVGAHTALGSRWGCHVVPDTATTDVPALATVLRSLFVDGSHTAELRAAGSALHGAVIPSGVLATMSSYATNKALARAMVDQQATDVTTLGRG